MPTLNFKAKMIAPDLEKEIKKEIRAKIKNFWQSKSEQIRLGCSKIYFKHIKAHQTYIDLENQTRFKGEMGVTEAVLANFMEDLEARLDDLFEADYVAHAGSNDLGGVLAYIPNYQDYVYEMEGIEYTTSPNRNEETFNIPWLKWLLRDGTNDVVFDYHFIPSSSRISRTGLGLMMPGGSFSVDPQYAGIHNNNWFTQAADNARPEIMNFIVDILKEL